MVWSTKHGACLEDGMAASSRDSQRIRTNPPAGVVARRSIKPDRTRTEEEDDRRPPKLSTEAALAGMALVGSSNESSPAHPLARSGIEALQQVHGNAFVARRLASRSRGEGARTGMSEPVDRDPIEAAYPDALFMDRVTVGTTPTRGATTWSAWQWTADGQEYNRLRTQLEGQGYRFIIKVQADSGTWEGRAPEDDTPASRVGWSIGSADGHWTWATTADIVDRCRRLLALRPVDLGSPISRARETFYEINEPVLARVPDHFRFSAEGVSWAGETRAVIVGAERLTPVREGGRYIVRNIPWRVVCSVELPRWANFLTASDADREEWGRFMRALRVHEQGHVDLAHRFIENIDPQDRQVTGATMQEIQENLTWLGEELRTSLQIEHDLYDERTGHGATQGATLRAPGRGP